jgi:hypothetical protein
MNHNDFPAVGLFRLWRGHERRMLQARSRTMAKSLSKNGRGNGPQKSSSLRKARADTYNQFKAFEGKLYTGMKVGGRHKWHYDAGEWKEKKITPDRWEFEYVVRKRRAGHAPEGSGVPVGTEYHWYIVAHQNVRKLDANSYSTAMTGIKFKVAHKRADKDTWSATETTQKRNVLKLLKEIVAGLEKEVGPLTKVKAPTRLRARRKAVRKSSHRKAVA